MDQARIDPQKLLKTFARTISKQTIVEVLHDPESYAMVNTCYDNVKQKVVRSEVRVQYGWTFSYRKPTHFQSIGYFMATHHAVWQSLTGSLVDVTPFNQDSSHQPYTVNGRLYFLVDDKAQPIMIGELEGPLPFRFFPLNDGKKLLAHLDELRNKERQNCEAIYQELANVQDLT